MRHHRLEGTAGATPDVSFDLQAAAKQAFIAPAYYRIRDVLRITTLSRPTLYRRIADRRFPPPVHLGGRACGWRVTALQAWISDPEGYRAPADVVSDGRRRPGRPRKYLPG